MTNTKATAKPAAKVAPWDIPMETPEAIWERKLRHQREYKEKFFQALIEARKNGMHHCDPDERVEGEALEERRKEHLDETKNGGNYDR